MSIDILVGEYRGRVSFIASINPNEKCTPGRNIAIIFSLAHVQCKNQNGDILGETVIAPMEDRLNNICDGIFLGWAHEGKIQFIILIHGCPIPRPSEKFFRYSLAISFFHWRPIDLHHFPWK